MIITCGSYYGTGSSAITDLVREYDDTYCFGDYEIRIFQDIDGVRDLEYYLVENYNRHNSGHALKRFKRLVDFDSHVWFVKKYEKLFDNQFQKISYEYIEKLVDYQFKGYWHEDIRDRGNWFYFRKRLANKLACLFVKERDYHINEMPKEITYGVNISEEKFLEYTREYSRRLLDVLNKDKKKHVIVDQLVPPNHIDKYIRYFDDMKVVVVERDPRDMYLLEKCRWKGTVVPHDVETFCKWWKATRAHRLTENLNTEYSMFVQFEDLIYHYDETVARVEKFLGFTSEMHIAPKTHLDPSISIRNTKLYEMDEYKKGNEENIKYIEEHLAEYLYTNY